MSHLPYSSTSSRSVSPFKSHQILDFSKLSRFEKQQYLNLIQKNNIQIEQGSDKKTYVTHIRVKRQKSLERSLNASIPNYYNSQAGARSSLSPSTLYSSNPRGDQVRRKALRKGSSEWGSVRDDNGSFSFTKSDENENAQETSLQHSRGSVENSLVAGYQTRGRSGNRKLFETMESNNLLSTGKLNTQNEKFSMLEFTRDAAEYYKAFSMTANIFHSIDHIRPKKMSSESLNRVIEEVFSVRFAQEVLAKSATAKKRTQRTLSYSEHSLCDLVYEHIKNKNKNHPENLDQNVLNLLYSLFWFRAKSPDADLFSRFLTEELDEDDMTFFLFLRFCAEKEMNLILDNWNVSTTSIQLTLRNCYKILEIVYGDDQREIVHRVMNLLKDHINLVNEKKKKSDPLMQKLPLYSFMAITLDDYSEHKMQNPEVSIFEDEVIRETLAEKEETFRNVDGHASNPQPSYESRGLRDISNHVHDKEFSSNLSDSILSIDKAPPFMSNRKQHQEQHPEEELTLRPAENQENAVNSADLRLLAPVSTLNNSPKSRMKSTFSLDNNDPLQEVCFNLMLKKIDHFIELTLFEGKRVSENEKQNIQSQLQEILRRKFAMLFKALFSFDKLRWLDALVIEDPDTSQLQNIEELQKDLRRIKKTTFEKLTPEDLTLFVNKIFRTPELSTQIGKLIAGFDSGLSDPR